jgi:catechol 2,3-dioxygenase-like lactoylglutathione lyase family enzyme
MNKESNSQCPPMKGMWHVALNVVDVELMCSFYVGVLGYEVEWKPDPDNVYLTRGRDNVAIHKSKDAPEQGSEARGSMDHIGFVLEHIDEVDLWADWLTDHGHPPAVAPKTHRDGARSFYVRDPEGNLLQFIFHPPLVGA